MAVASGESVIVEGVSWPAVALGALAVLPLALSVAQKKGDKCRCTCRPANIVPSDISTAEDIKDTQNV